MLMRRQGFVNFKSVIVDPYCETTEPIIEKIVTIFNDGHKTEELLIFRDGTTKTIMRLCESTWNIVEEPTRSSSYTEEEHPAGITDYMSKKKEIKDEVINEVKNKVTDEIYHEENKKLNKKIIFIYNYNISNDREIRYYKTNGRNKEYSNSKNRNINFNKFS